MLAEVQAEMEGRGLYGPFLDEEFASREELREQRAARAKRYGIGVKEKSNLTPPKGYPTDEAAYGDPVNLRYPADAAHTLPAVQYFNHEGQREKGGYSSEEWAIIGKRLVRLCSRHLRADYEYKDGHVTRKEEKVEKAATLKAQAQRLVRELNAVLAQRDLPAAVRKEAEDLRQALRKSWAQLAADGEGEEPEEAEEHGEREPFVHEMPFSLKDAEKRIVYGVVLQPGVPDAQGHVMTAEEIERACHRFMERSQGLDAHHARLVQSDEAKVVESWVQREPAVWRFGERETEILPGSWCLGVRFYSDELWAEVESGEITGYSPKGWGVLTALEAQEP